MFSSRLSNILVIPEEFLAFWAKLNFSIFFSHFQRFEDQTNLRTSFENRILLHFDFTKDDSIERIRKLLQ